MNYNWREQREKHAFLALEDGTVFRGFSVGARADAVGEAVFNTGMTGYQEILSDPSYAGQLVVMTYPEIGNTGANSSDMESGRFYASGLLVHDMNDPSSWRSEDPLPAWLERNGIPALAGLDTRRLTVKLRDRGSMKGCISATGSLSQQDAVRKARQWPGLDGQDYAARVTCAESYRWDPGVDAGSLSGAAANPPRADIRVAVYDFGIKRNILRSMRLHGLDATVFPAQTGAAAVLATKPDGVFLSNGPADPAAVAYAITAARELLGRVPMAGICLGHQILALAAGARTYRLKFGHHGCNHPVKDLRTLRIAITSQNHNFAVAPDSIDSSNLEITHVNLNDGTVEGIRHKTFPMFAAQYHPEACPGPRDSVAMFQEFRKLILDAKT